MTTVGAVRSGGRVDSVEGPSPGGTALARAGRDAIAERTRAHRDAIERTGVGRYYGAESFFARMSADQRRAWMTLRNTGKAEPPKLPHKSDCITWALENLEAAYQAVGRADRWQQISREVERQRGRGDVLARELQKDGWSALYWNPDVVRPRAGNAEHSFTAQKVREGRPYYGIEVQGQVTNYARAGARSERGALEKLREIPFFFGLAEGGKHTFVGSHGVVSELHWTHNPDSLLAVEETPLERFSWGSGVLMVPPGEWRAAR